MTKQEAKKDLIYTLIITILIFGSVLLFSHLANAQQTGEQPHIQSAESCDRINKILRYNMLDNKYLECLEDSEQLCHRRFPAKFYQVCVQSLDTKCRNEVLQLRQQLEQLQSQCQAQGAS